MREAAEAYEVPRTVIKLATTMKDIERFERVGLKARETTAELMKTFIVVAYQVVFVASSNE